MIGEAGRAPADERASAAATRFAAYRFRVLLASLMALLLLYPAAAVVWRGELFLHAVAAGVLLAGVLSVADDAWVHGSALVLALVAVVGDIAVVVGAGTAVVLVALACEAIFELLIDVAVLRSVVAARRVTSDTLAGGLCAYLLTGMAFASIYSVVALLAPDAFAFPDPAPDPAEWTDFVFFSFTTLTTLGYGDIRPVSDVARSLTSTQSILGVFYMAILVARLVSAYEERPRSESA